MNNQFTQRVSDVIQFSKEEANRLRNKSIQPEHLLLGLIREGEGKAVRILQSLYVDLQKIKQALEDELRLQADMSDTYSEDITFDSQASRILKMSILEARVLKSPATDTEHMLLAIMKENQNKASQILEENEVTYQKIWDKLVPKTEPKMTVSAATIPKLEERIIPPTLSRPPVPSNKSRIMTRRCLTRSGRI